MDSYTSKTIAVYKAGMQIGFGLSNMLAKFIKELNDTIYTRNEIRADREAWAGLVKRMQQSAEELQRRQNMSPAELLPEEDIEEFKNYVTDMLSRSRPPMEDELKSEIMNSLDSLMQSAENFRNEKSFEEAFQNIPEMPHAARELSKQYLQDLLEKAENDGTQFNVYMITIDEDPLVAKQIAGNVEERLSKENKLCHSISDKNGIGYGAVICYDRETQYRAKAYAAQEVCARGQKFVSLETCLMVAKAEKSDAIRFEGLSKATASEFERLLYRASSDKMFPAYVEKMPDGTYSIGTTAKNQKNIEKLIAESIAMTSGYMKEVGYDKLSEERLNQQDAVFDFEAGFGNHDKSSFGIYMDADSTPGNEKYLIVEEDRIRMITMEEGNPIEGRPILRSDDASLYDHRITDTVKNFCERGVFISEQDLKSQYNIDTSDPTKIAMNSKLKEHINVTYSMTNSLSLSSPEKDLLARCESDMMSYVIHSSDKVSSIVAFGEVGNNLDKYLNKYEKGVVAAYAEAYGKNSDQYKQAVNDVKTFAKMIREDPNVRAEVTSHLAEMQKNVQRTFDHQLQQMTYSEINTMVTLTEDQRDAILNYNEAVKMNEERIADDIGKNERSDNSVKKDAQDEERAKAQPYREKSKIPYWRNEIPYRDRIIPDNFKVKTMEDYTNDMKKYGQLLREKNPNVSSRTIKDYSGRLAVREDVLNMVRYDADPVIKKQSVNLYNKVNREIMETTGKAIYELNNDELKAEMPRIQALVSDELHLPREVKRERDQQQEAR